MVNLKAFFDRIGVYYKHDLEAAIHTQTGIDGQAFIPVTVATAKSRVYKNNTLGRVRKALGQKLLRKERSFSKTAKGKLGSFTKMDFQRLLFTKRFVNGAFKFEAGADWCRVFVNESYYSLADRNLVTYRDIVRYNNKGSGTNPRNPLIFPKNFQEVAAMSASQKAVREWSSPTMRDDMLRQMTADMVKKTTVEIQL
jgi:hypothetical protein